MNLFWLLLFLIVGALAGSTTILHSFAVAFDMFIQDIFWNAPIGVTISSRAGLAARRGNPKFANLIGKLFFNPDHCENAIVADIARAKEAIKVLTEQ